jgi:hypothetical protein
VWPSHLMPPPSSPQANGHPPQHRRMPPHGLPCPATARTCFDVDEHRTGTLLFPGSSTASLHRYIGLPPSSLSTMNTYLSSAASGLRSVPPPCPRVSPCRPGALQPDQRHHPSLLHPSAGEPSASTVPPWSTHLGEPSPPHHPNLGAPRRRPPP